MHRWPWIERTFRFDFPPEKLPDVLTRVRGTPARVEELVRGLRPDVLTREPGDGWTIQQNVGHLIDLGQLPVQRISEILEGRPILTAADMKNLRTNEAGHNQRDINDLLAEFRAERAKLVALFESLDPGDWGRSALHPRLQQPMRIVDIAYFDAEHDDYHLARINDLIRRFST